MKRYLFNWMNHIGIKCEAFPIIPHSSFLIPNYFLKPSFKLTERLKIRRSFVLSLSKQK